MITTNNNNFKFFLVFTLLFFCCFTAGYSQKFYERFKDWKGFKGAEETRYSVFNNFPVLSELSYSSASNDIKKCDAYYWTFLGLNGALLHPYPLDQLFNGGSDESSQNNTSIFFGGRFGSRLMTGPSFSYTKAAGDKWQKMPGTGLAVAGWLEFGPCFGASYKKYTLAASYFYRGSFDHTRDYLDVNGDDYFGWRLFGGIGRLQLEYAFPSQNFGSYNTSMQDVHIRYIISEDKGYYLGVNYLHHSINSASNAAEIKSNFISLQFGLAFQDLGF